jgi:two-component system invasion response regulator UvrY
MTRLLVVDDHEIVRAGVKRLLAEVSVFTVAGEAGSGADAVSMVRAGMSCCWTSRCPT